VKSFDAETRIVRVGGSLGEFPARWMRHIDPHPGDWDNVEFSTEPRVVWGTDVTEASADEPDAISEHEGMWTFVGTVLGLDPDGHAYVKGGRVIPPHDLRDGIFYLAIGDAEESIMLSAEGLDPDAAGRRVRVPQLSVELW